MDLDWHRIGITWLGVSLFEYIGWRYHLSTIFAGFFLKLLRSRSRVFFIFQVFQARTARKIQQNLDGYHHSVHLIYKVNTKEHLKTVLKY